MPTYQYQCKSCGHELEEFQSITAQPLTRCPKCNTDTLARVMGTGGGLIFKGSGFYLTDYKKTGAGNVSDPKQKKGDTGKENAGGTSASSTTKPDSPGKGSEESSTK